MRRGDFAKAIQLADTHPEVKLRYYSFLNFKAFDLLKTVPRRITDTENSWHVMIVTSFDTHSRIQIEKDSVYKRQWMEVCGSGKLTKEHVKNILVRLLSEKY